MRKSNQIAQLAEKHGLKLTALRQDILEILLNAEQPLGAYEVLHALRKTRPSAEPPTVYRVLTFLEEKKIVHNLSHNNTFIVCGMEDKHTQVSIVFTCNRCGQAKEFSDKTLIKYLNNLAYTYHLTVTNSILEISGCCMDCVG